MNVPTGGSRRIKLGRDAILFAAGIAGVFYETVFSKVDRPLLLAVFAAMMGLPAFLRTDERKTPPPPAPPTVGDPPPSTSNNR